MNNYLKASVGVISLTLLMHPIRKYPGNLMVTLLKSIIYKASKSTLELNFFFIAVTEQQQVTRFR